MLRGFIKEEIYRNIEIQFIQHPRYKMIVRQ